MKSISKTGFAAFVLLATLSCRKEQLNSPAVPTKVSATQTAFSFDVTTSHFIGENCGGGIIVYLDPTGIHSLIVATEEQEGHGMNIYVGNLSWGLLTHIPTGATGQEIGDGKENTRKIIAAQGGGDYAASLCARYRGGGNPDWYLPSIRELMELYKQRAVVPGLDATGTYCSSTEASATEAWAVDFASGMAKKVDKRVKLKVCPFTNGLYKQPPGY